MSQIVLGIGASHTPLFTLDADEWEHRSAADRANPKLNLSDGRELKYEQLLAEVGPVYEKDCAPEVYARKHAECEAALDHLGDVLAEVAPDVVVIVGDDQGELYGPDKQPAFSISYAKEGDTSDMYGHESQPDWIKKMGRGYMMDQRRKILGDADLGLHMIKALIDEDVEVAAVAEFPENSKSGLGHAFGFIVKRLYRGRNIPTVPVMLNTYYPPNVPSAKRCYDIGEKMARVIKNDGANKRVAIVASGGLSHFVVDEPLDIGVMEAIAKKDAKALRSIPRPALNSGSSEILNWVLAAGALPGLPVVYSKYVPVQRTPAGTGIGCGFLVWK